MRNNRICHRLGAIANDSHLWKSAYYDRFVRPRATRIPGSKEHASPSGSLRYSSRAPQWLEDERLVKGGKETSWKRQYKIRHNWSRGSCDVSEIQLSDETLNLPLLVQLHGSTIVTADAAIGLQAWSINGKEKLIAAVPLSEGGDSTVQVDIPTALAVDVLDKGESAIFDVVVGFRNGRFSVYRLNESEGSFALRYSYSSPSHITLTAIAYHWPYLVTLTDTHLLSLYQFPPQPKSAHQTELLDPPRLSCSLRSHTVWPPLSLSLRLRSQHVVVSIAYAVPTYLSGWSVGLQELRLTPQGEIAQSRLASAIKQGFTPLSPASSSADSSTDGLNPPFLPKLTSLSYNHPYLLAAHPDNTLTLFLVNSSSKDLEIGAGSRLWGHTSSVSGAYVGSRGRAVSVSSRGDELRVWELEGGINSTGTRRKLAAGELSVQVRPEKRAEEDRLEMTAGLDARSDQRTDVLRVLGHKNLDATSASGWIGFDEEKVVLLRQKEAGHQALMIYDFT